jgi:hypothetical protein
MTSSGDAAEQVVRLSLEGFEVAAKLTGSAAKEVAILLASVLKQEVTQSNKTRGKARLTSMIKSGKELKVFSIQQRDLQKFTQHAKKYGVLYCVLRDRNTNSPDATIDIISRAEDASKIQRIVDRFELGKVDKASIVSEAEKDVAQREAVERNVPTKSKGERTVEEAMGAPIQKEQNAQGNPTAAKTEKGPPSEQNLEPVGTHTDKGAAKAAGKKPSVREKLNGYKAAAAKQKEAERIQPEAERTKVQQKPNQTVHQQPKAKKKKPKER